MASRPPLLQSKEIVSRKIIGTYGILKDFDKKVPSLFMRRHWLKNNYVACSYLDINMNRFIKWRKKLDN